MKRLYSYVLRFDDGAAPNPFWGTCTLTICKPAIRRTARIGDWVIGTGSKNSKINDGKIYNFSESIVYAMRISDKMSLTDYNQFCIEKLPNKIPKWFDHDWRRRMGDCIYDYESGTEPTIRKGVHNETNKERDLGGQYALLSNHFYDFREKAHPLPDNLKSIIKKNQGHLKIESYDLVDKFEKWISQFDKNTIYAEPQLKHEFNRKPSEDQISLCSSRDKKDDFDENEETIC